jgi:hypothetical protein
MLVVAGAAVGLSAVRLLKDERLVLILGGTLAVLVGLVALIAVALIGGLVVVLIGVALAWLGFGLFALCDHLVRRIRGPAADLFPDDERA